MKFLDTECLAAFSLIIDHGSFKAAADSLNKSQTAVSMMVSRLETKLGVRILDRSHRRVVATPAGERLLVYARKIRALENDAIDEIVGNIADARVRLGIPDDYLPSIGQALVQRFHPLHPKIRIELHCRFSHQHEGMIEHGELDLAMITRSIDSKTGDLLRVEPQAWCAGPGHLPELENPIELALFNDGCRARPALISALDEAGKSWRIAYSSSHTQGIHLAVTTGPLLTALPLSTIPADWRRLSVDEGMPPLPPLELAVVVPPSASLATRQVASFIKSEFSAPSNGAAGGA